MVCYCPRHAWGVAAGWVLTLVTARCAGNEASQNKLWKQPQLTLKVLSVSESSCWQICLLTPKDWFQWWVQPLPEDVEFCSIPATPRKPAQQASGLPSWIPIWSLGLTADPIVNKANLLSSAQFPVDLPSTPPFHPLDRSSQCGCGKLCRENEEDRDSRGGPRYGTTMGPMPVGLCTHLQSQPQMGGIWEVTILPTLALKVNFAIFEKVLRITLQN